MSAMRRKGRGGNPQEQALKSRIRRGAAVAEALEPRVLLSSTSAYTWQNAVIGAGGFVDGIFYDPTNQNVIYARTDIGGLWKTTNDGQNWQQLLNWVGNNSSQSGNSSFWGELGVLSFAIDPNNSSNIYALVGNPSSTANGAFLYSSNGGTTWGTTLLSFPVNGNGNGRGDGERIAVDPNNSSVIYIGSNGATGVWKSTNEGQSFSLMSGISATANITFIVIPTDSQSSLQGTMTVSGVTVSDDIYIGLASTASGTNLEESINGGTSFATLGGTGTLPTKWTPGHAEFSGGYLYIGYANGTQPDTTASAGGVFRFSPGTTSTNGVWANISPEIPGGSNGLGGTYPRFGYDSIGVDPANANTLVVTSIDDYSGPDQIWRTTNANAATPTWTELFDVAAAGNFGFGGFNSTRNTANAPWVAAYGDGISNWAITVAVNPFNPAQIMYGTGQGIWATNNGTSTSTLTAPNSWYFPDNGIEFTAVLHLSVPGAGVPLISSVGDINGFLQTTLTSSPAGGGLAPGQDYTGNPSTSITGPLGNDTGNDFAQQDPNDIVYVGSSGTVAYSITSLSQSAGVATAVTSIPDELATDNLVTIAGANTVAYNGTFTVTSIISPTMFTYAIASGTASPTTGSITATATVYGAYSTNGGTTWRFISNSAGSGGGSVAMSANGATIVWAPSGQLPFYSTNGGETWTASSLPAGTLTGGNLVSDRVNPNYFYYTTENSADNSWTLYISSNGGQTFTASAAGAQGNGNITLVANPFTAGDLWFSSYNGIYHVTNFGDNIAQDNVIGFNNVPAMALVPPRRSRTTPRSIFTAPSAASWASTAPTTVARPGPCSTASPSSSVVKSIRWWPIRMSLAASTWEPMGRESSSAIPPAVCRPTGSIPTSTSPAIPVGPPVPRRYPGGRRSTSGMWTAAARGSPAAATNSTSPTKRSPATPSFQRNCRV